ncbi:MULTISPECIES: hypothetical protein [Streptomyces]|uniref:LexA family protein n=1 Tax=Streptomyces TaxID=1883 RepID=UPI0029A9B5D6|nr:MULTISPECIES: hypothetical protein [unclassified Streptomyces]MDX3605657.1 hypothetical protein [Streptomyces sp. FL06-04B]MDX3735618.1 hypothetical protein [Streptomyces sp. ID01-15D]
MFDGARSRVAGADACPVSPSSNRRELGSTIERRFPCPDDLIRAQQEGYATYRALAAPCHPAVPPDRRGPQGGSGVRREPRSLTARQEAVMAVIRAWLTEYGHGPTVREIGARVGLCSTSSVAHRLGRLETRGLISRTGRPWSTCVPREEQPHGGRMEKRTCAPRGGMP